MPRFTGGVVLFSVVGYMNYELYYITQPTLHNNDTKKIDLTLRNAVDIKKKENKDKIH